MNRSTEINFLGNMIVVRGKIHVGVDIIMNQNYNMK